MVCGPVPYTAPLLPFEKQLIESIGATEQEYRELAAYAIWKGRNRPSGYENVPDIRAEGVSWITLAINIAVSVGLYVVARLLAPKPLDFKSKNINLESINNAGRFNPTQGFESIQELANYGNPIPIIFSNAYYEDNKYKSGGLLISPSMAWTRMFSLGSQQAIQMLYVIGEQGLEQDTSAIMGLPAPELEGLFLGTGALDAIHSNSFAFYWKSNSTRSGIKRIRVHNK